MFQWARLPVSDAAATATADTTETQIGTGLKIPTWANGVWAAHFVLNTLALTTKEEVTGYFRLADDNNTIDPLNFPMPIAVCLTGAIGTHISPLALTVPAMHKITPSDTLRVYMALDAATTGVHVANIHLLLSNKAPPLNMHSAKSAAVAFGQTAGTVTAATELTTIEGKCNAVIGLGNSFTVYPTAGESFGGHMIVESEEQGWFTQRLPVSVAGSGLSTQITPFTLPVLSFPLNLKPWISQAIYVPFPDEFPMKGKGAFNFKNTPNYDQTVAGAGRYFLFYRE